MIDAFIIAFAYAATLGPLAVFAFLFAIFATVALMISLLIAATNWAFTRTFARIWRRA